MLTLEFCYLRRISISQTPESVLIELASGAEDLIDLGLQRVAKVASRLNLDRTDAKVLTVAGTNGKGSSVAFSEAILIKLGIAVGAYTSPHILNFNERIRINGNPVPDKDIFEALEVIRNVLCDTSLTYFEIATIASLYIFKSHGVDVLILEVGLGGRLDAVNILDPDVSLITSIDIDHTEWLGTDRESIGKEKAGILRPGRPAVIADPFPPESIRESNPNAKFFRYNREWGVLEDQDKNDFMELFLQNPQRTEKRYRFFPPKGILATNAGASIQSLALLGFEPSEEQLSDVSNEFLLVGRLQSFLLNECEILIDVAHNPSAVAILARHIEANKVVGKNYAIFAALKDKDIVNMLTAIRGIFTAWFIPELPEVSRGAYSNDIKKIVSEIGGADITTWPNTKEAWDAVWKSMVPGDRVVIFGSFYTISEVLPLIQSIRDGTKSGQFG